MWSAGYLAAGRANYMLSNLDNIPDLSGADRIRLEAEAKFIRAVAHFEMVRLFAQPYGFTSDNSHEPMAVLLLHGLPKASLLKSISNKTISQTLM